MGDKDEEVFFSLEDEEPVAKPAPAKEKAEPVVVAEEVPENIEILDAEVIMQATGNYSVEWQLIGMDCPDCASKATRALNHLPQVSNPIVSATSGEVRLSVDLEKGPLSEVSNVLRSLGHAPDTEHHLLKGMKAATIAKRNNIEVRGLRKLLKLQPGILDAEIEKDGRILVQLVSQADSDLLSKRDEALENVCGSPPKLIATTSSRLRPDQYRLLGASFAVPLLVVV